MKEHSIGKRLKSLREQLNINRRDFCKKYSIPENTYKSWENAINIPASKGLKRCLDAFSSEGLNVSLEWLLNGNGIPPHTVTSDFLTTHTINSNIIDQEINNLQKLHNSLEIFYISDDTMLPSYEAGSIVIGNRIISNFSLYHMKDCIVKINHNIFFRKLVVSDKDICLIPTNLSYKAFQTIINPKIEWIAPVFWHRKKID